MIHPPCCATVNATAHQVYFNFAEAHTTWKIDPLKVLEGGGLIDERQDADAVHTRVFSRGTTCTWWMAAASAALTRIAVVPLSMMAVVAPRDIVRPLTRAPSSVTVQYLHTAE